MTPDAADIFEHGHPLHDPRSLTEMGQLIEAGRFPKPHCPACKRTIPSHQACVLKNPLQVKHHPDQLADLHFVLWCESCLELMTVNVRWLGTSLKITSCFHTAEETVFLRKGSWGRLHYQWYLIGSRLRHGKKTIRPNEEIGRAHV